MESFPPDLAFKVKELARHMSSWIGAQTFRSAADANTMVQRAESCRKAMADLGALDAAVCFQLHDVAMAAAAVTLCSAFGLTGVEECRKDFAAACEPQPRQLDSELWRRAQDYFWASARLACAEKQGDTAAAQRERHVADRHARRLSGLRRSLVGVRLPPESRQRFSSEAARVMPATVVMLSTCLEASTYEPSPRTPYSGAMEGRCTELLLRSLGELSGRSWIELLWAMRRLVSVGRHADRQVPTLSCSRILDLNSPFGVLHPKPSGRRRALLVGINYIGQEGLEMSVGHKDVSQMVEYLQSQGYAEDGMQLLIDDGRQQSPTRRAIEEGMAWLVKDAEPGDSLFFLYSGHGCTYTGEDHKEAGAPTDADEALCPVDFRSAGMIFDDEIYRLLVRPLSEGVQLTCVVDCCQSGTVLHLPYLYSACEERLTSTKAVGSPPPAMEPNRQFDAGKMLQVIEEHPAMAAAAVFWAQELASMNPERHQAPADRASLKHVVQAGRAWASSGMAEAAAPEPAVRAPVPRLSLDRFVGDWQAEESPRTTLHVSVDAESLKVVLEGEDGDFKVDGANVKAKGDQISFDIDMDGLNTFTLTVAGGKLSGNWTDSSGDQGSASYVICSS